MSLDRLRRADDGGVRQLHRAVVPAPPLGLDSWIALLIYALGISGLVVVSS